MPRCTDTEALPPEARRREVARILAAAVVRLRTRPAPLPALTEKLSKSSPTALASAPCSATHVTVREDVNKQPENRP
jgi:hypothetical protein